MEKAIEEAEPAVALLCIFNLSRIYTDGDLLCSSSWKETYGKLQGLPQERMESLLNFIVDIRDLIPTLDHQSEGYEEMNGICLIN